ncbi:MAG: type II secretion system F family protein [Clostridiales bacterium]|nr:type II secretion system F family protein [Clostridiales bacterium]
MRSTARGERRRRIALRVGTIQWKELLLSAAAGEGVILILAVIAYDSFFWMLPLQVLLLPIHRLIRENRRRRLHRQHVEGFGQVLQSLMTSLQAGYSLENACRVSLKELAGLYRPDHPTVRQLRQIVRGIELRRSPEQMFMEYAGETQIEEIYEFAVVLHIAKSTGGNVVEILKNSMEHLQSRMEVTKELQVSMSGRIFEKNIMLCMPLGVLLYLRLANPGYVDSLYRIPAGNLLMTGVIAGMILCFFWTEKIMAVEL